MYPQNTDCVYLKDLFTRLLENTVTQLIENTLYINRMKCYSDTRAILREIFLKLFLLISVFVLYCICNLELQLRF